MRLRLVGWALLGGLVVAAPLLAYYVDHPLEFNARVNQVSIFASDWLTQSGTSNGRSAFEMIWQNVMSAVLLPFHTALTGWYHPASPLAGEPMAVLTAIFAANDQSAYGAMLALFNHGYKIPSDMSLVGFDDQYLSAYTLPPLTTVRQPSFEMGRAGAEGLLRLLDSEEPMLPRFPTELIIRKSAMRVRRSQ